VSHTNQARGKPRQPDWHELQGADTCTVKRNGYEWTCIIQRPRGASERCGNRLEL